MPDTYWLQIEMLVPEFIAEIAEPLGMHKRSFDREVRVIRLALEMLDALETRKTVVLVDSQTALLH